MNYKTSVIFVQASMEVVTMHVNGGCMKRRLKLVSNVKTCVLKQKRNHDKGVLLRCM